MTAPVAQLEFLPVRRDVHATGVVKLNQASLRRRAERSAIPGFDPWLVSFLIGSRLFDAMRDQRNPAALVQVRIGNRARSNEDRENSRRHHPAALSRAPTVIPRVASKYLEHGYRFAATRGVTLVPIELRPSGGYFRVRPLPALLPVTRPAAVRKVLFELVRYFLRVGVALTDLIGAVVPFGFSNRRLRGCRV